MIINLFITIKKNTKILHFAGSVLFLQFFLLSAVNSHFITLSEYSVCEYIFLFCMIIYAVLVYFLENKRKWQNNSYGQREKVHIYGYVLRWRTGVP